MLEFLLYVFLVSFIILMSPFILIIGAVLFCLTMAGLTWIKEKFFS